VTLADQRGSIRSASDAVGDLHGPWCRRRASPRELRCRRQVPCVAPVGRCDRNRTWTPPVWSETGDEITVWLGDRHNRRALESSEGYGLVRAFGCGPSEPGHRIAGTDDHGILCAGVRQDIRVRHQIARSRQCAIRLPRRRARWSGVTTPEFYIARSTLKKGDGLVWSPASVPGGEYVSADMAQTGVECRNSQSRKAIWAEGGDRPAIPIEVTNSGLGGRKH